VSGDLTANPLAIGEAGGSRRLLSSLYREIGLAAVAIELNLQLNILEPDVAEAIGRGAAALFHAGSGPSPIRHRRSDWAREKGSRLKVRRLRRVSKARRSPPFPTGRPEKELQDEIEGVAAARMGAFVDVTG
jgi:hypothetical protein